MQAWVAVAMVVQVFCFHLWYASSRRNRVRLVLKMSFATFRALPVWSDCECSVALEMTWSKPGGVMPSRPRILWTESAAFVFARLSGGVRCLCVRVE